MGVILTEYAHYQKERPHSLYAVYDAPTEGILQNTKGNLIQRFFTPPPLKGSVSSEVAGCYSGERRSLNEGGRWGGEDKNNGFVGTSYTAQEETGEREEKQRTGENDIKPPHAKLFTP